MKNFQFVIVDCTGSKTIVHKGYDMQDALRKLLQNQNPPCTINALTITTL